jgi:hypothetical protein
MHPESWDPKVVHYSPLDDQFRLLAMLDKVPDGEKINSRTRHYWEKPANIATGDIDDVYLDVGFNTAYTSGATTGTVLVIKPATASLTKVNNIRENMQVSIHSSSVRASVPARVSGVSRSGQVSFTIVLQATDPSDVMAGTGLTWSLKQGNEGELYELGRGVAEHESEFYNYLYTDTEAFEISRDKLREARRANTIKGLKMVRQMDALTQLQQRRLMTIYEGIREKSGDRYSAGGLGYFIDQTAGYDGVTGSNRIDWTSDTAFSATTDTVLGGTLKFISKIMRESRKWEKRGARACGLCSAEVRGLISECREYLGRGWDMKYGKTRYGQDCTTILSVDCELDIVEEPEFNHVPEYARRMYIVRPEHIRRHEPEEMEGTGLTRSKGLQFVPWSKFKKMDGDTYKSYIKGGWIAEETYSFNHPSAEFIIENLGYDKS